MLACATRRRAWPQHPPLPAPSLIASRRPSRARAPAALWVPARKARAQRHALNRMTPRTGGDGVDVSVMLGPCYTTSHSPRAAPAAARVPCELACMRRPCRAAPRHREAPRQRLGYPASSHARAGPAVLQRGRREPLWQQAGYPASSHARAGSAVRRHGRHEPPWQRRRYPASWHARPDPGMRHIGRREPSRQRRRYPGMHAQTLL